MIEVKIPVSKTRLMHLLSEAFEGGSNYWYSIDKYIEPSDIDFSIDPNDKHVYKHLHYPLSEGGALVISDKEGDGLEEYVLDLPACIRGIQVMADKYPKCFSDWLQERDDATTGDVYLQCCLFGEIVYE